MRDILLATDLSDRSDRALARALLLAEQAGAKLHLLCVVDDDLPDAVARGLEAEARAGLAEAVEAARSRGVEASCSVEPGRPHAEILRAAAGRPCDLVVLGTHRHDKFSDLFLGATVERLIRYGSLPVLVVRQPAKAGYAKALVAADFSPASERALELALALAPKAAIRLVHAFETPFPGFMPRADYAPEEQRERHAMLETLAAKHSGTEDAACGRDLRCMAVEGDVDAVLRRVVAEERSDVLALGTHGRTGVAHAVLGSVAERFLSHPPCDVLVVR